MNDINIAKVITKKRKEKGITQDDLADFIGVSKAAVSKWETEQTYPDIVLLPRLAAYFNISLDELMGYEPQMTGDDIRRVCEELAIEFGSNPFEEVKGRCCEIANKYFSCLPLLYQIGLLFTNYALGSKDEGHKVSALTQAKELSIRVKNESRELILKYQALAMEATCEKMLGNHDVVIDLFKDVKVWGHPDVIALLSQAYIATGKTKEAKIELQSSIYQSIMGLFEVIPPYIDICTGDAVHFEEMCRRTIELIKLFNLKKLYPALIIPFYVSAAQGYLVNGRPEKSLDMLEIYTAIATEDICPSKIIKGDSFFNLIDDLLEEESFIVPRDEKSIKQGMADEVIENPVFSALSDEPRFKKIAKKLILNIEGTMRDSL